MLGALASVAAGHHLVLVLETSVGLATPMGAAALLLSMWALAGLTLWSALTWARMAPASVRESLRAMGRALAAAIVTPNRR